MSTLVSVQNLSKSFGKHEILKNISFSIEKGEVIGIIGPSGAGKSTILRCVGGLESATAGSVAYHDYLKQKKIGIVFQHLHLWPHKTALENVTEALRQVKKYDQEKATQMSICLLKKFNLEQKQQRYPEQLSGGEQQRVAIARALAISPQLLLFDEITSALDGNLVYDLLQHIKALAKEGLTMVIVSHHLGFIKEAADHVLFLKNGIIEEQGTPAQIFDNPKEDSTKNFVQKIIKII